MLSSDRHHWAYSSDDAYLGRLKLFHGAQQGHRLVGIRHTAHQLGEGHVVFVGVSEHFRIRCSAFLPKPVLVLVLRLP
ncbi:hypothetical protein ACFXC8_01600 [Streptomyces sp. NPDC059441]|uniref:hypothetical protein n=1 Tax=Streptomyces sp. NPDC059441 TaxID=3346829 RepID=UPI0036A651A5